MFPQILLCSLESCHPDASNTASRTVSEQQSCVISGKTLQYTPPLLVEPEACNLFSGVAAGDSTALSIMENSPLFVGGCHPCQRPGADAAPAPSPALKNRRPLSIHTTDTPPLRSPHRQTNMLSAVASVLLAGLSVVAAQLTDPRIVGTWSSKSNSTFTGPVC